MVGGMQLSKRVGKKMKSCFISYSDKSVLRKRAVMETISEELKNVCQIEHSRHRSFANFVINLLSGLAAYCFLPKKPSINIETEPDNALTLF